MLYGNTRLGCQFARTRRHNQGESYIGNRYYAHFRLQGTQLYDPAQGKFVDLSILDVLQIFGRAGRPGMESSGVGYIFTTEDKLTHYLDAVTAQVCRQQAREVP